MSGGLISRVADHCFWMGRYVERAESTSRLLQTTRGLVLDTELTPEECWRPLLVAAGEDRPFIKRFGEAATSDAETVEQYMTWDESNLSSLFNTVCAARENTRSIREVVSLDAWESLNELYLWLTSTAARQEFTAHRYGFHRTVCDSIQLCLGLLRSTMLHDTPLDFIWMGVMLELAGQTARLLDMHQAPGRMAERHPVVEMSVWLALLRAVSSLEPFLQRHRGKVTSHAAATFLILDPSLPRSLRYCLRAADEKLRRVLPRGAESSTQLATLTAWVESLDPATIDPRVLHVPLTRAVDGIAAVCEAIDKELFVERPGAKPEAVVQETATSMAG